MESNKVDFDLSILSLEQLIELFNTLEEFRGFLNDGKIVIEEAKKDE